MKCPTCHMGGTASNCTLAPSRLSLSTPRMKYTLIIISTLLNEKIITLMAY